MSDTLILGLATLVVGLISPILILIVTSKLNKTHKLINSRMSELLAVTKTAATAEGKAEGKQEQKEETKNEIKN